MASIETRELKSGALVHWVRWRKGGKATGKPEGERFEDIKLAVKFKSDVEYYKHEYPPCFVPKHGYVTEAEMAVLRELAARAAAPSMPLLDAIRDYINRLSGIQDKTRTDYHALANNYFAPYPAFAAADVMDVSTFTKAEVAEWIQWMDKGERDPDNPLGWLRTPKAPKTVANAHGLLYGAAKSWTEGERPPRSFNPCADSSLPELDDAIEDEDIILTGPEYEILREAAKPKHRAFLDVFFGTGMRFSECAAQQLQDYTPGVQTRVQRTWHTIAGQQRELGRPKGKRGRRRISLDPVTDEAFARCAHGKTDPRAFLLTAEQGGPLRHNHFFILCWQPTVYRAVRCEEHRARDREVGMEFEGELVRLRQIRDLRMPWLRPCLCEGTLTKVPRIHDARHSHVSWLLAQGVPLAVVSRRIGHDSATFTDQRYGHLMPESELRAAAAIGAVRGARRTVGAGA